MFQIHVDLYHVLFQVCKNETAVLCQRAGLIILEVFQDFEYGTAVDIQNTSKVIERVQVVPRIAVLHSKWAI